MILSRVRLGIRSLFTALAFSVWLLSASSLLSAPETLSIYLSGRDAENTVPWEFFCSGGRNSGVWTKIGVPSCWELQGFGSFRYGFSDKYHEPIRGDYRHRFDVPAEWSGRRVFIVFDGAMTDATVKINGTEAGPTHQGSFYRFKYDITKLLRFGEKNLLEVSVLDQSTDGSVNRAEREADYWIFGGIFRPVWLQAEPAQFIDRVAIDAKADGSFALDYFLGGEGGADTVSVTLLDSGGKPVGKPPPCRSRRAASPPRFPNRRCGARKPRRSMPPWCNSGKAGQCFTKSNSASASARSRRAPATAST